MGYCHAESLQGRWRARLRQAPEKRALAFIDRQGRYEWRSFGQLCENAARYAAALTERGLARGDVCVLVGPSNEFCATTLLAIFLVGAVPVLVAPPVLRGAHSNLPQVLRHVVRKTRARLVVLTVEREELGAELPEESRRTRFLFGARDLGGGGLEAPRWGIPGSSDIAALQLTSGTTGFPRICVWEQRRVLASLDGMRAAMDLGNGDVCLNWTPLYHDMGLVNNFLLCLTHGIPLVMLDAFDFVRQPALWLRGLAATGATVTWSPNFGYALAARRVEDHQIAGLRLDRVRAFWNAAERIHLSTIDAFHRRFAPYGVRRHALKTNYGCAENVGGATFSDPRGDLRVERLDARQLHGNRTAVDLDGTGDSVGDNRKSVNVVGVGRPCPGMTIHILSRTGGPLPDGRIGEIALSTPSRMNAYLGAARDSRQALRGELVRTGDLGYLREEELFWVGRARERINLRGRKLDPSDLEGPLLEVPGLRQGCFAAFGVADPELGSQRLVIVSEVREPCSQRRENIVAEVREQVVIALGARVDEVLLLPQGSLSKTSSGKRRHRFYRQLYLAGGLEKMTLCEPESSEARKHG